VAVARMKKKIMMMILWSEDSASYGTANCLY